MKTSGDIHGLWNITMDSIKLATYWRCFHPNYVGKWRCSAVDGHHLHMDKVSVLAVHVWVCADTPLLCVCVQMLDSHRYLLHVWIPVELLQIMIKIWVLLSWPLLWAKTPSILTHISILSPKFCKWTTSVKESRTHQCTKSKNAEWHWFHWSVWN